MYTELDWSSIKVFVASQEVAPSATILEWLATEEGYINPNNPKQQHDKYIRDLLIDLILQMADEELEIHEDELEKQVEITHGKQLLAENVQQLIHHIDPSKVDVADPSVTTLS